MALDERETNVATNRGPGRGPGRGQGLHVVTGSPVVARRLPYLAGGLAGVLIAATLLWSGALTHRTLLRTLAQPGGAGALPAQNATPTATPGPAGAVSPPSGTAPKLDIRSALRAVEPGVVFITDFAPSPGGGTSAVGQGTGMVLTTSGLVLTNAHVVAAARTITVQPVGQTDVFPAKVVASDPTDDVAVVQIQNPGALTPVPLGHSSGVQVGDPVVAIGNALGLSPGGPSVTSGIISALHRTLTTDNGTGGRETLTNLLQTDAAINPGNSGGPLVDAGGLVIGMNTAVSTDGQNVAFVIPIDRITPLLGALEKGTVPPSIQGFLGVSLADAPNNGGALVQTVNANSPGAAAGMQAGDIITAINGTKVAGASDAQGDIQQYDSGTKLTLTITRNGAPQTLSATLGSRPATS